MMGRLKIVSNADT